MGDRSLKTLRDRPLMVSFPKDLTKISTYIEINLMPSTLCAGGATGIDFCVNDKPTFKYFLFVSAKFYFIFAWMYICEALFAKTQILYHRKSPWHCTKFFPVSAIRYTNITTRIYTLSKIRNATLGCHISHWKSKHFLLRM